MPSADLIIWALAAVCAVAGLVAAGYLWGYLQGYTDRRRHDEREGR